MKNTKLLMISAVSLWTATTQAMVSDHLVNVSLNNFDNIIDFQNLPNNITEVATSLSKQGYIPGISKEKEPYVEKISGVIGFSVQDIVKIGEDLSYIPYVLKEIRLGNLKEINGIKKAYEEWHQSNNLLNKKGRNAVISAFAFKEKKIHKYRLKLAWHERLFHDVTNGKYYELLHAAKGKILSDCFKFSVNDNFEAQGVDWSEALEAYRAFGAVLGALFKERKINYRNDYSLDIKPDNLFFDQSTNTITWIDLEWLGGKPLAANNLSTLNFAMDMFNSIQELFNSKLKKILSKHYFDPDEYRALHQEKNDVTQKIVSKKAEILDHNDKICTNNKNIQMIFDRLSPKQQGLYHAQKELKNRQEKLKEENIRLRIEKRRLANELEDCKDFSEYLLKLKAEQQSLKPDLDAFKKIQDEIERIEKELQKEPDYSQLFAENEQKIKTLEEEISTIERSVEENNIQFKDESTQKKIAHFDNEDKRLKAISILMSSALQSLEQENENLEKIIVMIDEKPRLDEPQKAQLIARRDELFANIQKIFEVFVNAFILNYAPQRASEIRQYFKETYKIPFNHSPEWRKEDLNNPFAFCYLLPPKD